MWVNIFEMYYMLSFSSSRTRWLQTSFGKPEEGVSWLQLVELRRKIMYFSCVKFNGFFGNLCYDYGSKECITTER
jgi:hypothetical protein